MDGPQMYGSFQREVASSAKLLFQRMQKTHVRSKVITASINSFEHWEPQQASSGSNAQSRQAHSQRPKEVRTSELRSNAGNSGVCTDRVQPPTGEVDKKSAPQSKHQDYACIAAETNVQIGSQGSSQSQSPGLCSGTREKTLKQEGHSGHFKHVGHRPFLKSNMNPEE